MSTKSVHWYFYIYDIFHDLAWLPHKNIFVQKAFQPFSGYLHVECLSVKSIIVSLLTKQFVG